MSLHSLVVWGSHTTKLCSGFLNFFFLPRNFVAGWWMIAYGHHHTTTPPHHLPNHHTTTPPPPPPPPPHHHTTPSHPPRIHTTNLPAHSHSLHLNVALQRPCAAFDPALGSRPRHTRHHANDHQLSRGCAPAAHAHLSRAADGLLAHARDGAARLRGPLLPAVRGVHNPRQRRWLQRRCHHQQCQRVCQR